MNNQKPTTRKASIVNEETRDERIRQARAGQRGPQQQLLATIGLDVVDLLLRKNQDYGGSVFKSPELMPCMSPGDALLVRMSDKLQRLRNLQGVRGEVDESTSDTVKDLAGYSILWLCCVEGSSEEGLPEQ